MSMVDLQLEEKIDRATSTHDLQVGKNKPYLHVNGGLATEVEKKVGPSFESNGGPVNWGKK